MSTRRTRVLFLCTHNSCRSQMAEGWANALLEGQIEARSAGTTATTVNPLAGRAMKEAGIDISHHISKSVDGLLASGDRFDYVITVCDSASHACPNLPGNVRTIHQSFDDPPQLVRSASTEAEAFQHYLRVRDEIRDFVRSLPPA